MKFQTIKDGTYEDNGAVFEPFAETYESTLTLGNECERFLKLFRANKARFADTQYWAVRSRKTNAELARQERARVAIAVTSNLIALQESDQCLTQWLEYLDQNLDTLHRRLPELDTIPRYAGMNQYILGKVLHTRLFAMQTRLRSTIAKDPTNGSGKIELRKAFDVIKQGQEERPQEQELDCPLSYIENVTGLWVISTPEALALTEAVGDTQALVLQAQELWDSTDKSLKCLDERQFGTRLLRAKDDALRQLTSEQALAQCEVASPLISLLLLMPSLEAAGADLCKKLRFFISDNCDDLGDWGERAVMIFMNNCVFASELAQKVGALLYRIDPGALSILETSGVANGLQSIFNGEVPLASIAGRLA